MSIKLSHSSINTYLSCPKSYYHKYKTKVYPKYSGSALFFGSAIDEALNEVLTLFKEKKSNEEILKKAIKTFDEKWEQKEDRNLGFIDLPKYEYILYSKYDFDGDLMQKEDWKELYTEDSNASKRLIDIQNKLKEVDFKDLHSDDKMFYNYANWLCTKRKGHLLLEAYVKDLLPNIEEVVEVQKTLEIEDDLGNKIHGVADFLCVLKPGKYGNFQLMEPELVIPDNKTSSYDYEEDSVRNSQQLSQYKTILNTQGYKISKGAYFVMKKKLTKDVTKICKSCGHVAEGSHKTCNNVVNGVRCNGEWEKSTKFIVPTQIVVDNIPDDFSNIVMENADEVLKAIESEIFPRNLSACDNMFGSSCPYKAYCFGGCMDDVVKGKDNK